MNLSFVSLLPEKSVECMGINLRTAPQRHFKADQVAFAKAETENGFYSQGTGKNVILSANALTKICLFLFLS